ncbi:D-alanyl-D-alanine carboxypeptidase [Picosynechococcus sp. NKBG15041c]|uniref:D-alanyl-D-alanine carboxypeptidase n=1 Tax=Picosynechococcus sp. NKBG15041c TaxID=1407650 RepID=UPI000409880D|nr:D-alanyl-D-alanine carboxypeptidase [Picosynechococcus sp. NKBG15041c]
MLYGLGLGVLGFLGLSLQPDGTAMAIAPYPSLQWQEASLFEIRHKPDRRTQEIINQYLEGLAEGDKDLALQGIWFESAWSTLGTYQGEKPLAAASLTKIATTLAALETWPVNHQFTTKVYQVGSVENGILRGNLIVESGGNPLFVWEEAIAIGNALNQAGIRQVEGDLVIVGELMLNFVAEAKQSGDNLRRAFDQRFWDLEIRGQYNQIPGEPPQPQVAISGQVLAQAVVPEEAELLLTHQSLPLTTILKQLNLYSNNAMAEAIADQLGGGPAIGRQIAQTLEIPEAEIQLINGSGLGVENQISPRATVAMLQAIETKLQGQPLNIFELFPIAGQDQGGTLRQRTIPPGIAIKTGTLNQVSALAGVIPTQEQGNIWFAIINNGTWDVSGYRQQQDQLLQNLNQQWQLILPQDQESQDYFGNLDRIQVAPL